MPLLIVSGLFWWLVAGLLKWLPVILIMLAVWLVVQWLTAWMKSAGTAAPLPRRRTASPDPESFTLTYRPRAGSSPADARRQLAEAVASAQMDLSQFGASADAPGDYARLRSAVYDLAAQGVPARVTIRNVSQDGQAWPEAQGARASLQPTPDSGSQRVLRPASAPMPGPGTAREDRVPTRGLVIMSGPLDQILSGRKTLELRGSHNRQLGPVALIRKGTGQIEAVAEFVDSIGPLSLEDLYARATEHQVDPRRGLLVFSAISDGTKS